MSCVAYSPIPNVEVKRFGLKNADTDQTQISPQIVLGWHGVGGH